MAGRGGATPTRCAAEAERCLRALAGPAARAAGRPVDGDQRAGRRPASGPWSSSGPAGASRRCTSWPRRCCGRAGLGPTVIVSPLLALMRNQIDAAARAGIRARTVNSANTERLGRGLRRGGGGRGRRAAGQPGAAEQPWLPRPGAAQADRRGRHAGRGRGALHLRLGPRLPARLPAAAHAAGRTAAGRPGAGHHGHRQRAGHPGRRRAARRRRRRRDARAARPAGPRQPAPGRGRSCPARSSGWPGWPSTWASCPAPASSTR